MSLLLMTLFCFQTSRDGVNRDVGETLPRLPGEIRITGKACEVRIFIHLSPWLRPFNGSIQLPLYRCPNHLPSVVHSPLGLCLQLKNSMMQQEYYAN